MIKKIYNIDEIRKKLEVIFKNTLVKKAILFGSYANNSATSNSDIDLVIDTNNKIDALDFYNLLGCIIDNFKKEIDLIEIMEIIPNSKVDKEIKEKGVVVYESKEQISA
ncbi:MAG: nucleotidyltransferase domain-containing protein [Clostridia bacterium]